jgi:hypothetical protein
VAIDNSSGDDDKKLVQFVSICCGDSIDGAREIIEATQVPRWNAMRHYFMAFDDKERAKQLLNFRTVPFYFIFDRHGNMIFSGNKMPENCDTLFQDLKAEPTLLASPTSTVNPLMSHPSVRQELIINDMDF